MDRDELKREKYMDDAQDAERGDEWDKFKYGLNLQEEWAEYLNKMDRDDLIDMIIIYCDINYSRDDLFDSYLQEAYDGKY